MSDIALLAASFSAVVVAIALCVFGARRLVFSVVALWDERSSAAADTLPSILVLVPAWNEAPVISQVLRSLERVDYPAEKLRITLIDDAYNASPPSVTAALDMLAGLPGRRIAVLGEMLELGKGSVTGHREVGTAAAATVDLLIVVGGGNASLIAAGARAAGLDASRVLEARDREAALDLLRARLRDGDVVLVKASRGVELDLLVDALRAELSR